MRILPCVVMEPLSTALPQPTVENWELLNLPKAFATAQDIFVSKQSVLPLRFQGSQFKWERSDPIPPYSAAASPLLKNLPNLPNPVAVVDIGSNTIKLVLLKEGQLQECVIGSSLQAAELHVLLEEVQQELQDKGVRREDLKLFATEGFRKLGKPGEALAQRFQVNILDGQTEGALIRKAVTASLPEDARKHVVVVEIGGGSTEWAFENPAQNKMLPLGTHAKNHHIDVFDVRAMTEFRLKIRPLLEENAKTLRQGSVSHVMISSKDALRQIVLRITGKNLHTEPISAEDIERVLSPKGLQVLKTLSQYQEIYSLLPIRLAILLETMRALGIQKLTFGSPGSMKAALLHECLNSSGGLM